MNRTALLLCLVLASSPVAALPPTVNTFSVHGTIAAIITQTAQVGFTISVDGNEVLIPCPASAPTAGCDQVEVGHYVQVNGHFGDYQIAGDDTLYNVLVLDEIWRCQTGLCKPGEELTCTLLIP